MMEIRQGVELPRKRCRGRPKGLGVNISLLLALRPDQTVWDVGKKKMRSIIVSAQQAGIKLMVRRIPDTKKYAFKVIHDSKNNEDKRGSAT